MSSNNDSTDDQQQVSRRDLMAGAAAMGLTLSPGFLGFGSDNELGYFDTHEVQNSGETLGIDPSPLNFGSGLQAKETAEGGVDVTAPGSSLTEWSENDTGTLSGPSLSTDQINNVDWWMDENDDPQGLIDDFEADVGVGTIGLKDAPYTFDAVTLGGGVTLKGPSPDDEQGQFSISPSADNDCVILDPSDGQGSLARAVDLVVDTSNITGYSSSAIKHRRGFVHQPSIINCNINLAAGNGTGIHWHDNDGNGLTHTSAVGCRIDGGQYGVHFDASFGSGAFVNDVSVFDTMIRASTVHVRFDGPGDTNGWKITGTHQPSANTQKLLETSPDAQCVGKWEAATSDVFNASSAYPFDLQHSLARNQRIQFRELNAPDAQRRGTRSPTPRNLSFVDERIDRWLPGALSLPYWLTTTGTGTLNHINNITEIQSGSTSGDSYAVDTGGTVILQDPQLQDPSLHWQEDLHSTTQVISRTGIVRPGSTFEARFYCDPTDSLATGITSNYIARVVDEDGTVLAETDTGVSFGSSVEPSVVVADRGSRVYMTIGSNVVEDVALNTTVTRFGPSWEVETTEAAAKTLRVMRSAELRYVDAIQP